MGSFAEGYDKLSGGEGKVSELMRWFSLFMVLLTTPVIILTRRNFGERYLSYTSIVLILFFLFPLPFVFDASPNGLGLCFVLFFLFLGASIYHIFTIWNRNRKGIRFHSRYDGDILPIFKLLPVSESASRLFFEPLFIFFLGVFFAWFIGEDKTQSSFFVRGDVIFPVWFICSAPFMMLFEKLKQSESRNRILDAIDAQIEAQYTAEALEGAPPEDTEGYVVRGISDASEKLRNQLLARLNKGAEQEDKEAVTHGAHVVSNPSPPLPPRPPVETQDNATQ